MNIILFYSSIIMLIIFIVISIYYYKNSKLYYTICIIAIIASILAILNHGYKSIFLKYLDRSFIVFTIVFHLFILNRFYKSKYYKYLLFPIIFYMIAKYQKDKITKTYFHLLAHITIVFYHIILFSTNSRSFSIWTLSFSVGKMLLFSLDNIFSFINSFFSLSFIELDKPITLRLRIYSITKNDTKIVNNQTINNQIKLLIFEIT